MCAVPSQNKDNNLLCCLKQRDTCTNKKRQQDLAANSTAHAAACPPLAGVWQHPKQMLAVVHCAEKRKLKIMLGRKEQPTCLYAHQYPCQCATVTALEFKGLWGSPSQHTGPGASQLHRCSSSTLHICTHNHHPAAQLLPQNTAQHTTTVRNVCGNTALNCTVELPHATTSTRIV